VSTKKESQKNVSKDTPVDAWNENNPPFEEKRQRRRSTRQFKQGDLKKQENFTFIVEAPDGTKKDYTIQK
jgi:hypothetical protein